MVTFYSYILLPFTTCQKQALLVRKNNLKMVENNKHHQKRCDKKGGEKLTDLVLARSLFGTTMGFHIIYASLGVGIPLMILLAELIFQKRRTRIMPSWPNDGQKRRLFC